MKPLSGRFSLFNYTVSRACGLPRCVLTCRLCTPQKHMLASLLAFPFLTLDLLVLALKICFSLVSQFGFALRSETSQRVASSVPCFLILTNLTHAREYGRPYVVRSWDNAAQPTVIVRFKSADARALPTKRWARLARSLPLID